MRPHLPAILSAPGGLGYRFALNCFRQFFGLRTFLAVSSVASGRIEFVSRPSIGPLFYRLSIHFQLLSTPCRHDAVTFSCWREAPPKRDFSPSRTRSLSSALGTSRCDVREALRCPGSTATFGSGELEFSNARRP